VAELDIQLPDPPDPDALALGGDTRTRS